MGEGCGEAASGGVIGVRDDGSIPPWVTLQEERIKRNLSEGEKVSFLVKT